MTTKLQQARQKAGISQEKIAKTVGLTKLGYQNYEYGRREPRIGTAILIADALGIQDVRSLWGGNPTS